MDTKHTGNNEKTKFEQKATKRHHWNTSSRAATIQSWNTSSRANIFQNRNTGCRTAITQNLSIDIQAATYLNRTTGRRANTDRTAIIGRRADTKRIPNIDKKTDRPPAPRQHNTANTLKPWGKPGESNHRRLTHFLATARKKGISKCRIEIKISKKPEQGLIAQNISVASEKFATNFPKDGYPWNRLSVKLADGYVIRPKFGLEIEVLWKGKKA